EVTTHAAVAYQRADAPINALRFVPGGAYVATGLSLTYWTDAGGVAKLADGDFRSIAIAGGYVYATHVDGTAIRVDGNQVETFTPPTSPLVDDGGTNLYAFTGPIYRYSGTTLGDLAPPTLPNGDHMVSIVAFGDTTFAASTTQLWQEVDAAG